jgi:hypothetical protein
MTRDGRRLSPRESSHAGGALGYRTDHTLYFSLRLGVFALKISALLFLLGYVLRDTLSRTP